jgi:hypothetical protein
MKEDKDPHTTTQPVILIGVDRQEAPEFEKLSVIVEDETGLKVIENHYNGIVSVEMRNDQLVIYISKKE